MQQPEISLDFSKLKIDSNIDLNTFKLPESNYKVFIALYTFQEQPETKKQLSPYRFWKSPNSLKERCIQFIAAEELKAGERCNRDSLPIDINEKINDKLEEAKIKIDNERLYANLNFNFIKPEPILNNTIGSPLSKLPNVFNTIPNHISKITFNDLSEDIIISGEYEYKESVRQVERAASFLVEQHLNPNSFFSRLNQQLLIDIASEMRNSAYQSEENARYIAKNIIAPA